MKKLIRVFLPLSIVGIIVGVTLNWGTIQKAYASFNAFPICEDTGNSWICGTNIPNASYSWSASYPLYLGTNSNGSTVLVRCHNGANGRGSVRVTVTKNGNSDSGSKSLNCGGGGGEPDGGGGPPPVEPF